MNPRKWSFGQFATAGMLIFIFGIITAGTSWKTNVDRTNCAQSDSIYVNAVKYEMLQEYCVQLQAVDRVQTQRLNSMEALLESSSKNTEAMLREMYYNQMGREWEE